MLHSSRSQGLRLKTGAGVGEVPSLGVPVHPTGTVGSQHPHPTARGGGGGGAGVVGVLPLVILFSRTL